MGSSSGLEILINGKLEVILVNNMTFILCKFVHLITSETKHMYWFIRVKRLKIGTFKCRSSSVRNLYGRENRGGTTTQGILAFRHLVETSAGTTYAKTQSQVLLNFKLYV